MAVQFTNEMGCLEMIFTLKVAVVYLNTKQQLFCKKNVFSKKNHEKYFDEFHDFHDFLIFLTMTVFYQNM